MLRDGWLGTCCCLLLIAASGAHAQEPATDAGSATEATTESNTVADDNATVPADTAVEELESVTVIGRAPTPAETVAEHITTAAELLRNEPLHYTYLPTRLRDTLRGRPMLFAGWSQRTQSWHIVEIETPYPTFRWVPGGRPPAFRVLTPGYEARHVRGTGTERLMFDLFRDGERLQVLGRKYPIIDTALARKRGIRVAVAAAETTLYLPLSDDAAPLFVDDGLSLLRNTAETALRELREKQVPSFAYPDELLADTVLPETLMSLAVIEQTDDSDLKAAPETALNLTIGHYGVMQTSAFTYSVSRARAVGPMQFTDRRGRGTYSQVVRRCEGADLSPDFDSGARDLLNAMKAAACLLDMDLAGLPTDVQNAYVLRPEPTSIFQVASYNGGGRNASRLLRSVRRLKVELADLRVPDTMTLEATKARCPCVWSERDGATLGQSIPRYNRENPGYVDKHLRFLSLLQSVEMPAPDTAGGQ